MKSRFGHRRIARWTATLVVAVLGFGTVAHAKEAPPKVKISAAQATKIAKKKYPGKVTKKTVLENEDGKWQYAVMIRSGKVLREVQVDANTGAIVDAEVTTEAKEAAEAKEDAKKANGKKEEKEADEKDEKNEKK
ncbi:MAG: PepSY domain-containing protein [Abitibacteriaceae bacterium]|nr:PepSY domain-containing protein [Abditibacteriaceae bacterium]